MITKNKRFQILLHSLSNKYTIIRDDVLAQDKSNVKISLQKLQEKKAKLGVNETIMWAKRDNRFDRSTQYR